MHKNVKFNTHKILLSTIYAKKLKIENSRNVAICSKLKNSIFTTNVLIQYIYAQKRKCEC